MTEVTPEVREKIDAALGAAGWLVQDANAIDLSAARGVAVRNFPLGPGQETADYLLYVDEQAVGAVETKPEGDALRDAKLQSWKYGTGLPKELPAPIRPLPFLYESNGDVIQFTNRLDPEPTSRQVSQFHKAETLSECLTGTGGSSRP